MDMSIGSITSMLDTSKTNASNQATDKLSSSLSNLSSSATEEELKGVINDFTSYFVEEVIKKMKETFSHEDEEEKDSTMSQYEDLYMDKAIEMVADEMVEQIGGNYTQQLYEAMKRNYNIIEK